MELSLSNLRDFIKKKGKKEHDFRFNRDLYRLPGHFYILKRRDFKHFQGIELLKKYDDDILRMKPGIMWCAEQANQMPNSRRLLVLNTEDYNEIYQCFNLVQFINTEKDNYDMYVYQRSQDLEKWKYDIRCFLKVKEMFEDSTLAKITKIVVIYGDLHYEPKK